MMEQRRWKLRIAISIQDGYLWERTKKGNYLGEIWKEGIPISDIEVILGKNIIY